MYHLFYEDLGIRPGALNMIEVSYQLSYSLSQHGFVWLGFPPMFNKLFVL